MHLSVNNSILFISGLSEDLMNSIHMLTRQHFNYQASILLVQSPPPAQDRRLTPSDSCVGCCGRSQTPEVNQHTRRVQMLLTSADCCAALSSFISVFGRLRLSSFVRGRVNSVKVGESQ